MYHLETIPTSQAESEFRYVISIHYTSLARISIMNSFLQSPQICPYLNAFILLLQRPVLRPPRHTKPWTTLTAISRTSSPTAAVATRRVSTTNTTTSSTTSTTTNTSTSTSSPRPTTSLRPHPLGHSSVSSKLLPICSTNRNLKLESEQFLYKTTASFFTIIAVFLNYYSNGCVT